jgi:predicted transglutaminase-like cysteine proteinase
LAIAAAVPAIPTKPNTPAINATIKNINDQLNIVLPFSLFELYGLHLLKRLPCHAGGKIHAMMKRRELKRLGTFGANLMRN